MDIRQKDFEKAIETAYRMGSEDSLANLMTPQEVKRRVRRAILEAYNILKEEEKSPCTKPTN